MTMSDELSENINLRCEKAVKALYQHPSVVYAGNEKEYDSVWCGLTTNTDEDVETYEAEFGLVEPKVRVEYDDELGPVMDIWWHLKQEVIDDDFDEWIENHEPKQFGQPLEEVMGDG